MDFQKIFLEALRTDTIFTKAIFIQNYLPKSISTPLDIAENLPYIQAYGNIFSNYPYYYGLSHLDCYCLITTEGGCGTLIIDNHKYVLIPGTLAFINCHESHKIEIRQSPWNYKVFFLRGISIPFLYNTFISDYGNLHTFSLSSNVPNIVERLYRHLNTNSKNSLLQTRFIMDIILELIIEKNQLKEPNISVPSYLIEIKNTFNTNYQKCFSLDGLEQKYHISKYRICREFTKQYNISPIKYLNQKRIEVAKEALINTDKRINEIGRMVGFENTNNFIRLFKQITSVTPLMFRKQPPAITYFY